MTVTEKTAYLKGLLEGLKIDDSTDQGKLLTVIVEWPNIPAKPLKKVMYLPLFPIFMLTYMPIALAALFMRVEWKPIRHTSVEKVKA